MTNSERDRQSHPDTSRAPGKVGIFWIFKGELIHNSVPVTDGEEYGDFVNGLCGHCTYWPHVQRTRPETRHHEYEQVPRGRVVYRKHDDIFLVYGSERFVRNEAQKQLVLSAFGLAAAKTVFRADEHYGPVPGMLEE